MMRVVMDLQISSNLPFTGLVSAYRTAYLPASMTHQHITSLFSVLYFCDKGLQSGQVDIAVVVSLHHVLDRSFAVLGLLNLNRQIVKPKNLKCF